MERRYGTEGKYQWEAQYWWAFSCLALAGRRSPFDFHAELLRRSAGHYPTPEQVEGVVDEAISHIADVFNAALVGQPSPNQSMSGWRKHVLALTMTPDSAKTATDE
jgi:hypothetical protein